MEIRSLKYLFVYIVPFSVLLSIYLQNIWSFSTVILIFFIFPVIELFTRASPSNLDIEEEAKAEKNPVYDLILYGLVPFQYIIMAFFLLRVSNENLNLISIIGMTSAYGMSCGILGINAAHELGHRTKKYEQLMGKMLLITTLYMHFFIEHNRGHHKNVSTPYDPATARLGEPVFMFYLRSIAGSWISAWNIESKRLKRLKVPIWSIKNEMLLYQFFQIFLLLLIGLVFGFKTMLWFVLGSLIGILLLETVNYIEHYGLNRKRKGDGFERTLPVHSWNSNHPVGRLVLLELSRHSDHHYMASRKFQILRHFDNSPQMPAGYPAMMLLSLIPPLWFYVMHKTLASFKNTEAGKQLG